LANYSAESLANYLGILSDSLRNFAGVQNLYLAGVLRTSRNPIAKAALIELADDPEIGEGIGRLVEHDAHL
jgi:hypothetical protein